MNFEFEYPNIHMSHVTQLVMIIIIFMLLFYAFLNSFDCIFNFQLPKCFFFKESPKVVPTKNLRFHNHTSNKEIDNLFISMFSKFMFQNTIISSYLHMFPSLNSKRFVESVHEVL